MQKIKVLHLLQSNKYSGAESVVCQIIDSLRDDTQYEMIYVCPRGPIEKVLLERGIEYFGLNSFTQKEINRAISVLNPDIIHAHDFNASVRVAMKNKAVISHLHNNPLWFSQLDYRTLLYTLCLSFFKKVIGVSTSIKDEYIFSKQLEDKFVVLPNVVDYGKVIKLSDDESGLQSDLLFVGRLSHEKRPIEFLQVIKQLKNRIPNIKAIIIGEGALQQECLDFINKNELMNNVVMLGFEANPYKYMKKTKLLIMTSIYEGFGLVAVEAMILGVPVLCRPVGGLVNIIDDETGVFCENISDFTGAAYCLLTDETKRRNKGAKAKIKAKNFCNMEEYKNIIKSIYEKIGE